MNQARVFIRRLVRLVVIVLVVGVFVSDGTQVLRTFRTASGGMNDAMNAAAYAVRANPTVSAQQAAADAAASRGAVLESYEQAVANQSASLQVRVNLSASAPLGRTYVAAPIVGLITQVPAESWYDPGAVKITLQNTKLVTELGLAP
jgi:hypothetical protein